MGIEKQENGHRNSGQIKLNFQHDQELFGRDHSDSNIFLWWLFRQTVENQINIDLIMKICKGIPKIKYGVGLLVKRFMVVQ